jgi:hypothetical protein
MLPLSSERWVLLNIANEAGARVSGEDFLAGYRDAITRIRGAGIRTPLVIDGVDWGKEYRMLLSSWRALNEHDPLHSVIVSAHTYWIGSEAERQAHFRYIIDHVTRDEIAFVHHAHPERREPFAEAGDAKRRRAHVDPAAVAAEVEQHADYVDRTHGVDSSTAFRARRPHQPIARRRVEGRLTDNVTVR